MFEMHIARGIAYLDQDLGPSWIDRINLDELELENCYHCIIGQIYGDFWDKFFSTNHAVEYGFCLSYTLPRDKSLVEYRQLTYEWKEKITQLKAGRGRS